MAVDPYLPSQARSNCSVSETGPRWNFGKPFCAKAPLRRPTSIKPRCATSQAQSQVSFPRDYPQAIQQAQASTKAALADGATLIDIEFPTSGLSSVPGDGEGANEMTYSLGYLRQFCRIFQQDAATTRIFFPDQKEMQMAAGQTGRDSDEAVFGITQFQLDYLTNPSMLHDIGLGKLFDDVDVSSAVRPQDTMFIAAYPHFNVGEMVAVEELWQKAVKGTGRPIIVFNGELDRIRSGYYPPFFYPGLARMAKTFLTQFTTAYYVHNFKGSRPGVLFRAYPGRWQVLRRDKEDLQSLHLIHEQDDMPSLKTVSMEILAGSR